MLGALSLFSLGCARVERAQKCQALAETINSALDEIEALQPPKGKTPSPAQLRATADKYAALSKKLEPEQFAHAEMQSSLKLYREHLNATRASLLKLADAKKAKDERKQKRLLGELRTEERRDEGLVKRLDRWCKAP